MARTRSAPCSLSPDGVSVKSALTSPIVVAALVAGLVSLASVVAGQLNKRISEREARRRDSYAKAFESYVAYREFPFVVRRRSADKPVEERERIARELREVQERLGYYRAWIHTESRHCGLAFDRLISKVRINDGKLIHEGWSAPAITSDEQMNIKLPLVSLGAEEDEFLHEVSIHLALRPRWMRRRASRSMREQRSEIARLRTPPTHEPPGADQ